MSALLFPIPSVTRGHSHWAADDPNHCGLPGPLPALILTSLGMACRVRARLQECVLHPFHSFIHWFKIYFLVVYYVPGTVLSAKGTRVSKQDRISAITEATHKPRGWTVKHVQWLVVPSLLTLKSPGQYAAPGHVEPGSIPMPWRVIKLVSGPPQRHLCEPCRAGLRPLRCSVPAPHRGSPAKWHACAP